FAAALDFHDEIGQGERPAWWRATKAPPCPAWTLALDRAPSTWLALLLLAAASPLLAAPRARGLALLSLGSAAYFVLIPALAEVPLPRYRLPAVPFLALAAGAGLAGLLGRVARDGRDR